MRLAGKPECGIGPRWVSLVAVVLGLAGVWFSIAPLGAACGLEQRLSPALGGGQIISGATRHRLLHLTFDDGPDPEHTPRLLDALDKLGVKATFFFSATRFVAGRRNAERAKAIARDALRRGHTVGSHAFLHQRLYTFGPSELRHQLDRSETLFRSVLGARPAVFRPPFGARSRRVDRQLAARGYTTVLWNLGLADWVKRPPHELVRTWRKVLRRREREHGERGGIVLLHDTHAWTVDAVPWLVQDIRRRNCELLATDQELFELTDDLGPFVVPRGADVRAFAPPVQFSELDLRARQRRVRAKAERLCSQLPFMSPQRVLDRLTPSKKG